MIPCLKINNAGVARPKNPPKNNGQEKEEKEKKRTKRAGEMVGRRRTI